MPLDARGIQEDFARRRLQESLGGLQRQPIGPEPLGGAIAGGGFTFQDPAMAQQMALNQRNLLMRGGYPSGQPININQGPDTDGPNLSNPAYIQREQEARQRFGDARSRVASSMGMPSVPSIGMGSSIGTGQSPLMNQRNQLLQRRRKQNVLGQRMAGPSIASPFR